MSGIVDLGTLVSCGPRMRAARATLDRKVDSAGNALQAAGAAVAFVVGAEGDAELTDEQLRDTLALAAILLAQQRIRTAGR